DDGNELAESTVTVSAQMNDSDLYEVYALAKKHWRRRADILPWRRRYKGKGKGKKGVRFQRNSGWSFLSEAGGGALCPGCTWNTQEYYKGTGKGEQTNPRGANGQPFRCDLCNSEKHLWRKCDAPGADDYRRKRATSGGTGYVTTEGNLSTGGAQPASSFSSALQRWQQLTGQPAASTATRHFFAMPSSVEPQVDVSKDGEKEYEDSYYPDVKEEGSRLCESHARPDLQVEARRDCASTTSWDLLSTPSELVDIGSETIQMIEQAKARIMDDPDPDVTLEEPQLTSEQVDPGNKPAGLKWFVGPVFERYDEARQVFLEATRIDGKECLLRDPGAYDNLVGDRWIMRMGTLAKRAFLEPTQYLMDQSIGVEGVGTNAQIAKEEVKMPGAAKDERGNVHQISYKAPVVPDSDIPALWGKRSLKHNRAVVDMINNKLYLCGPGRVQFTPPPGTLTFNLEDPEIIVIDEDNGNPIRTKLLGQANIKY
ncbi:unnamed protein product, partial [Prorocentrum cordatum]